MNTLPAAEQQSAVPGTYQYTQEVLDLLLHDREMLTEATLQIIDDVQACARRRRLHPAEAYALVEAEVRNAWPAAADAVLIMVGLDNAGLLRR